MKPELSESIKNTAAGQRAEQILRKCVHCGFCNATCPTYQLLGDELDGPRGRIYLIKSMLEGNDCTDDTRLHLDRCLTCRSCETTCPSGVEYNQLLEIGRHQIDQTLSRSLPQQIQRKLVNRLFSNRKLFSLLLKTGQSVRKLLPAKLKSMIPEAVPLNKNKLQQHQRRVILLQGCVQPALSPEINHITESLLDRLGISVSNVSTESCCGALPHHLDDTKQSRRFMKNNIDAWFTLIDNGVEAIISTASGCGLMIKEYGDVLRDDAAYAEKARIISNQCMDISEFLQKEDQQKLAGLINKEFRQPVFQSPCTLQHGQKLAGVTESLLTQLGVQLNTPADPHLCCGSAGTYSIFQPKISRQLRRDKLEKLTKSEPDVILTANIGCLQHLQQATNIPVKHWIYLFREGDSVANH